MGFLLDEAGPAAVGLMREIKQALDPKDIMNPGKIFAL
jgi:D-lactate dehydrogenase (cytochrome)